MSENHGEENEEYDVEEGMLDMKMHRMDLFKITCWIREMQMREEKILECIEKNKEMAGAINGLMLNMVNVSDEEREKLKEWLTEMINVYAEV